MIHHNYRFCGANNQIKIAKISLHFLYLIRIQREISTLRMTPNHGRYNVRDLEPFVSLIFQQLSENLLSHLAEGFVLAVSCRVLESVTCNVGPCYPQQDQITPPWSHRPAACRNQLASLTETARAFHRHQNETRQDAKLLCHKNIPHELVQMGCNSIVSPWH